MTTVHDAATDLKTALTGFGTLKVWSVLVTIFGDLAPAEGDQIAGPDLSAIVLDLGIRPEALRVALHRLRKDGWIETAREGRISLYRLTPQGRAQTSAVTAHIYSATIAPVAQWFLIQPKPSTVVPASWLPLGAGGYASDRAPDPQLRAIAAPLAPSDIPDWARDAVIPRDVTQACHALNRLLTRSPLSIRDLDPATLLALRILILHTWRRIALRHSPLAAAFMGPDWAGAACRATVQDWLRALPRPAPERTAIIP